MGNGEDALARWKADAMPLFESLLATTKLAMNALRSGPDSVFATWDEIREVAVQGQQWLKARPCPDQDIGGRLRDLVDRCERLGAAFAVSTRAPSVMTFDDLATRIRDLGTGTVELLGQLDS